MKAFSSITVLSLTLLSALVGCRCMNHDPAPPPGTYVSMEHVDGEADTTPVYHATSRVYCYAKKSIHATIGKRSLGLEVIRFEITTRTAWHERMDGLRSRMKIAAYVVSRQGGAPYHLWTITPVQDRLT